MRNTTGTEANPIREEMHKTAMTQEQINQKKITAHDRIAEVVSEMDKHKDIDLDMLVDGLSDIRDLIVWDEPDQAN
jgi:hypothetical protein